MWRVPVQTKLSFLEDVPVPHLSVWDQLNSEQKRIVIEMLARLSRKMIMAKNNQEHRNDGQQD
jgi:hypothetical protein